LNVFAHTTPAPQLLRHPEDARPLLRPHAGRQAVGVLFAFSTASSGVRNESTESTGPKISSWAIRWLWATLVKTVGANQ
jgi:hypothetical protein